MRRSLVVRAVAEALEPRQLRTAVYPTAYEQYAVELVNRARANPTAEAARWSGFNDGQGHVYNGDLNEGLAPGTISAAAKQPLAISPYLTSSARGHSQWQIDNQTFSHTGAGGSDPGQREVAAGYNNANTWGENISITWSSSTPVPTTTLLGQQRGLFTDQSISDRGHRTNMMNGAYSEIGIGVATGPWNYPGYGTLNALVGTHDFASNGTHFLTGVSYADNITHDNFYTPGEGLGGIIVTATRISDGQTFSTTTWTSGGYSLALPAGTYNLAGTGGGLASPIYYNSVTIGSQNVKEDFVAGQASDPAPTPSPAPTPVPDPTPTPPPVSSGVSFASVDNGTLRVTGTVNADSIGVSVKHRTCFATVNGVTQTFSTSQISHVFITADAGDDRVAIGAGVENAYVDGGAGNDTLLGGAADDSLYGGSGNDFIYGNDGADVISGGKGKDHLYGGAGNDRIYGNAGNDIIDCGSGNDHAWGGIGNDVLLGGAGRDALYGEEGADTLNGGRGTDYFEADILDTKVSMEVLVAAAA